MHVRKKKAEKRMGGGGREREKAFC
jgi:hypothetical protein